MSYHQLIRIISNYVDLLVVVITHIANRQIVRLNCCCCPGRDQFLARPRGGRVPRGRGAVPVRGRGDEGRAPSGGQGWDGVRRVGPRLHPEPAGDLRGAWPLGRPRLQLHCGGRQAEVYNKHGLNNEIRFLLYLNLKTPTLNLCLNKVF